MKFPKRLRQSKPKAGNTHNVLFYAINGIGSGHIIRVTSIARAMQKVSRQSGQSINMYALTTSEAPKIAFVDNLATFKFPTDHIAEQCGLPPETYPGLAIRWIQQAVEAIEPHLIVVDSFPDGSIGSFKELPKLITGIPKKVIIFRPSKASYLQQRDVYRKLEQYDLIVIPEREADAGLQIPERLQERVRYLGPIMVREREEALPREEARARLGVADGQKIVYLSCGGGGDNAAESMLHSWLDWLSASDYLLVVGAGPLYRGRIRHRRNLIWTDYVPICEYMTAFDAAVCTTGYMSFNELMYFGVPTAFVPVARDADDQLARARRAVQHGTAMLLDISDAATLPRIVADLCAGPGDRLKRNAERLYSRNYATACAVEICNFLAL
jgi:predicted glycosyltransferase